MSKKKSKKSETNDMISNLSKQKIKNSMQDPVMSILFGMLPAEDKLRQQIEKVVKENG